MKPLVVFPDVAATIALILRDALATRPEPYAQNAHVSTVVPVGKTLDSGSLPYVLVAQEVGGEVRNFALLVAATRVTCWAATEDEASDLANLAHGLLLAHPGGRNVRSCLPSVSPFPAMDPETGEPIASFDVVVNVVPSQLN